MMSDVLAYVKDQAVLLTGLNNPQVVRTADMMDMICIVFVRGKKPGRRASCSWRRSGASPCWPQSCPCSPRAACCTKKGCAGGWRDWTAIRLHYTVPGDDFTRAGEASADLKARLKKLGDPAGRCAQGMPSHCMRGRSTWPSTRAAARSTWTITDDERAHMTLTDQGPGIPDIALAMSEGLEHRARRGAQPRLRRGHGPAQHEKIFR